MATVLLLSFSLKINIQFVVSTFFQILLIFYFFCRGWGQVGGGGGLKEPQLDLNILVCSYNNIKCLHHHHHYHQPVNSKR